MLIRRRPHPAILIAAFLALAAGGLVLLLIPARRHDAAPGSPAPPPWAAAAPNRSQFEGRLQPIEDSEARQLPGRIGERLSRLLPGLADRNLDVQVNRTLLEGYEYEARVVLTQQPIAGGRRLELEIQRAGEGPVSIEADIIGNQLGRVAMITPGTRDTLFALDHLDPARLQQLLKLPLALGDLQLQDLSGLLSGVGAGAMRVAGRLEQARTLRLLVLSITFPAGEPPEGEGSARRYDGRGASALVYLDAADSTPRAIRVFDGEGRLVRIYEDFEFEGAPGGAVLRSFRIASLPTASHSSFRFRQLDRLAAPAPRSE